VPHDREVSGSGVPETLAIDRQRSARREDRLADDELPPSRELDDEAIRQFRP